MKSDDPITRVARHFRREAMHLRRISTVQDVPIFDLFVKAFEDPARVREFLAIETATNRNQQPTGLPPAA
jgi:hypothetical protein